MIITIKNGVDNTSLQVGDSAHYVEYNSLLTIGTTAQRSTGQPTYLGIIDAFSSTTITINNPTTTPTLGSFIMFSKDKAANNTSLIGYYAEVELKNDSKKDAELFSLSSEITVSSK